jgi:hypothetical protein
MNLRHGLALILFLLSPPAFTALTPPSYSTVACTKSGTWAIDSIVGTVTVTGTVGVTGVCTAANQTSELTKLDSLITNTTGLSTAANQSTELTRIGDVTEAAPASDTASSGLNGRLQRIAQRLTTLIGTTLNVAITNATLAVTQSGSWVLSAGSAIIGKVGIDQTGTANAVQIATSTKATYWTSNGATAYTPPAASTDMVQIQGSATKTVRVLDFVVCASATAAGAQTVFLVKRSVANSGGTSTLPTMAPLDSASAGATAVVRQYSAVATSLGAAVGTPRPRRMFFQITAGTTVIEPCTNLLAYVSDNVIGQPFTLRGTAESLSLNNNAAALAAGYKIDSWYIVWTEE